MAKRLRTLFNQNGIQAKQLSNFDAIKGKLLQEMVDAKTTLMLNEVRREALKPVINAVDGQMRDVPSKQLELAEMNRAEKVAAERVSEIERSLNQAKLMEAVNSHTSNFQIIDRPQLSGVTVASKIPKVASAFLLAVFLALATFFGLDMMDRRLKTGFSNFRDVAVTGNRLDEPCTVAFAFAGKGVGADASAALKFKKLDSRATRRNW